jgi:GxxExxY protein
MNTDAHRYENGMTNAEHDALTEEIISCAFKVLNTLGLGFLEKVYENALAHELRKNGHKVSQQAPLDVIYDGIIVGDYQPDLLVDEIVILEIKATRDHHEVFEACCLNYVTATRLPVCLLLNFGKPRLGIKRFVGPTYHTQ